MFKRNNKNKRVLLAMSGGVDSSVSALLLQDKGYEVIGIHFVLDGHKKDFDLVQKVSRELGIKLITEDVSEKFQKKVIDYLIEEYSQNRTPNPCVKCNREIKFDLLKEFADRHDCEKIATGHYAQIKSKKDLSGKQYFSLNKAVDQAKDQTYYLYRLNQSDLKRIVFPLGGIQKDEIKKIANKKNLSFNKQESQDICFIAENEKIEEFLRKNLSGKIVRGEIINEKGKVLGSHKGLVYYTIGQRKGLDLGGGPYFVIGKDTERNKLIVSSDRNHSDLLFQRVNFRNVSWVNNSPEKNKEYFIKIRYQGGGLMGNVFQENNSNWVVQFNEFQWAPASGQSLVIYDEDEVVGGGVIC